MSPWHGLLAEKYGHRRVEDVLEGTPLADKASTLGFGLYVIRDFVPAEKAQSLMDSISQTIDRISKDKGM